MFLAEIEQKLRCTTWIQTCFLQIMILKYNVFFIIYLVQSTWIGLLHHVCNEHDWSGGSCEHGELEEHDLPWFDRRDKDFEALQKIVLDSQLLSSFKFYVRFR